MVIHSSVHELLTTVLWSYLATRNMRVARTIQGSVGSSSYYSETERLQLHHRSDCNRATLRPPGPNYLSAGCKWHWLLLRVNHKRRAAKRALRFSATAGIENAEAALDHFEIRSRIATSDIALIFLLLLIVSACLDNYSLYFYMKCTERSI